MAARPSWHAELGAFISLLFLRMSRDYDWMGEFMRDVEKGHRLRYGSGELICSRPSSPMLLDEANAMQFSIARSMDSPRENAQASALSLSGDASAQHAIPTSVKPGLIVRLSRRDLLKQSRFLLTRLQTLSLSRLPWLRKEATSML